MSRSFFLSLPDWNRISTWLEEQATAHREAAFEAMASRNYDNAQYERGYYDALRTVLETPANLLKDEGDDEKEESQEKENVTRIVPVREVPRANRLSKVY